MSLCKMVRSTILTATLAAGCAVPKAVCTYEETPICKTEYSDAFVQHHRQTDNGTEYCAVHIKFKNVDCLMTLLDSGCDGTVDVFLKKESGELKVSLRQENEEYFRDNLDKAVQDTIFNEMKEGGKK